MIVVNAGNIMEKDEHRSYICPLSLVNNGYQRPCIGKKCAKWVSIADAAYLASEYQSKQLNFVYESDEDKEGCGFCSL